MRVAVVGVGGTGAAAAWRLAQQGHEVVAFERHAIGHARGSSHGPSRIIRRAYQEPEHARLMGRAFELWDETERAASVELFVRCGLLLVGRPGNERLEATRVALTASGVAHDVLEARDARRRFPAFALGDDEVGLFESGAGFLRASDVVAATVGLAREAGAGIVESTVVESVTSDGGGVLVRFDGRAVRFDAAVVAAGAWIDRLVPSLRGHLRVSRQQVLHLAIERHPERFAPERMPTWIDAGSMDYGFPSDGRNEGVKIAAHVEGPPIDPDAPSREPDLAAESGAIERVRRRLPDLSSRVTQAQACLYTWTRDELFVLDRVPDAPNVVVCSACSGHGFKFTALMGALCADLIAGRELPEDARLFGLARLSAPE